MQNFKSEILLFMLPASSNLIISLEGNFFILKQFKSRHMSTWPATKFPKLLTKALVFVSSRYFINFSGFRNLLKTHWKLAAKELYNGFVLSKTVESAKKFIPSLTAEDFVRWEVS